MVARRILAALIVVSSLFIAPAGARSETAATVNATLHIGVRSYDPPDPIDGPIVSCQLSVTEGGDAIAVLDAAVAKRCIESYIAQITAGRYLYISCINRVCERDPGLLARAWWESGPSSYTATEGSEIHVYFSEYVYGT